MKLIFIFSALNILLIIDLQFFLLYFKRFGNGKETQETNNGELKK